MSHSCTSSPQSAVLSLPLNSIQSHHPEYSTSVVTSCDTPISFSSALPTPPDSDSSPSNNPLSNIPFSSSQSTQSRRSPSPSQINLSSSPKLISSSHSNPISMSTNQIVNRQNNTPLKLQENGMTSSYTLSNAVSSNSRELFFHSFSSSSSRRLTPIQYPVVVPYSTSCPTSSQFSYDHMFPDSSDSQSSLSPDTPSYGLPSASRASGRTPNVYINGLPPNFPEQDLFALACPFGNVKSVRSFTRHVSEKPT